MDIESIVKESVLADLCGNADPIPLSSTELEKQNKKPFKRKNNEIVDLIEIDCDDHGKTAKKCSLEKTKSPPPDSHGSMATRSPLLSNLLSSNQNPVEPQNEIVLQPPPSGVLYKMTAQICTIFIFYSEVAFRSYFALVLSGGTLFLPNKMLMERREILRETKNTYNVFMRKINPTRKSYDTIEVVLSNNRTITVDKPGSGILVFQKIKSQEPFFVTQGGLSRISQLHKALFDGKDWVLDLKVLKLCMNLKQPGLKDEDLIDLRYLKMLCSKLKTKGTLNVIQEFQNLKDAAEKYPIKRGTSYDLLHCTFCNTKFDYAVEHMYHLFKDKKCSVSIQQYCKDVISKSGYSKHSDHSTVANAIISDMLTKNIILSSLSNLKCEKCPTVSLSKMYHFVHLDRHLRKGRVFPCYKCRKIFLAPFWFIQHRCVEDISTDTSLLSISNDLTTDYLYGKVDKNIRDLILTCPSSNCSKKYEFISGMFGHLQLRTPCLMRLVKNKTIEFEWNCSIDFGKLITRLHNLEETAIQCEICNEICHSELGYLMHVDHHRLNVTLECRKCFTDYFTACSFYSHSCITKSTHFCLICDEFKKRESDPYIQKKPMKSSVGKSKNITELARSIENLMDNIMNYNGEENDPDMRVPSEENTNEANNQYQNTFIDYLNNTLEGNHIGDPGLNVIDLSEDDSGLGNASGDKEAFDSIEDLLAESDGDEYMEPDFEVKSEKK